MSEKELLKALWEQVVVEYAKNRYITEDESSELYAILERRLLAVCEIYERDE